MELTAVVMTALHSTEPFEHVLEAQGLYADVENRHGWRPLHLAAELGRLESVRALLRKGVDAEARDRKGWTALMLAATTNNIDVVELLLTLGFDGSATEAFILAIKYGVIGSMHIFLQRGFINVPSPVPLAHVAIQYGQPKALVSDVVYTMT